MIQSGILTTIDSTTGQSTGVPVRGAWINFVQNNVTKATVQTNIETGAYSVDVPLGKYTVKIAVGDVTGIQRAGQLFELKAGDKADAFHKWFYGETGSIDDDLLKQFKQISNDINASANRAESAEKGAKQIETNMKNNSIGDANGAWLKEGASKSDFLSTFGTYYSPSTNVPMLVEGMSGLATPNRFSENNNGLDLSGLNLGSFVYFEVQKNYVSSRLVIEVKGYSSPVLAQSVKGADGKWSVPVTFHSTGNTKLDKNGVLHATTGTTKDTLLVGDLGLGAYKNLSELEKKGFPQGFLFGGDTSSSSSEFGRAGAMMHLGAYASTHFQLHFDIDAKVKFRRGNASTGVWNSPHEFWTTVNTIVDTNGNIKRASPTVELFNDHIKFTGFGDQVPIFEKLAIGTYKISNTHGMARTGWTYQKPQGKDGNYFFKIRVQKLDDGCIVTVHDYYVADEEVEIIDEHGNPRKVKKQVEVLGMPRDIKDNERWINLRFHEQIYSLTNELPELNVPYRELWGIEPYIPPIMEQIKEDIALEDQRAF